MPALRRTKRTSSPTDEDFEPRTPYQEWINPAMDRAGITLSDLADAVGADRTYLWRIARGNPDNYPKQRRPGYELAYAIGEKLGDIAGSLKAAEYPTSQKENTDLTAVATPKFTRVVQDDEFGEIRLNFYEGFVLNGKMMYVSSEYDMTNEEVIGARAMLRARFLQRA